MPTKTKTILGSSGLLMAAVGSVTAYVVFGRKRRKSKASAGGSSTKEPTPPLPPPPPSPFVRDSGCTVLADQGEIQEWLKVSVVPLMLPRLDAYDVPLHEHEQARQAVEQIADELFSLTVVDCRGYATSATRLLWKALWCEVAFGLVLRGKLDEELDDLLRLCADPSFDPRVPVLDMDQELPEESPPPGPLLPMPEPLPGPPIEPMPPMDGIEAAPPSNAWLASSRQELSELGVMRMIQGTVAGTPIIGPVAHVVVLAYNPIFGGLQQARADMTRLAAENPGLTFVEVSFVDTQRHFGKPSDVNGIMWALAATGPDGRVFPEPIVRNDFHDAPPSEEEWTKVVAHASGFVGLRSVREIVVPRRYGDLVLSMTRAHRPPRAFIPAMRPRRASSRPTRRRGK